MNIKELNDKLVNTEMELRMSRACSKELKEENVKLKYTLREIIEMDVETHEDAFDMQKIAMSVLNSNNLS
jgi:hypothetical protein